MKDVAHRDFACNVRAVVGSQFEPGKVLRIQDFRRALVVLNIAVPTEDLFWSYAADKCQKQIDERTRWNIYSSL